MPNAKIVKQGTTERYCYSTIKEVLEMPNLIEIQTDSYQWFLDQGLKEVFEDVGEITDYNGTLALSFPSYRLNRGEYKYNVIECKERDATFAAPLRVTARLENKETGEIKESEIFMGDFPIMTDAGTFVINGAERVIVSQLVRSPGVYYANTFDRTGKKLFTTTVIPNRGAWLEYETDSNDYFYVRIDKNRKIPITTFLRALLVVRDDMDPDQVSADFNMGLVPGAQGSDQEIYEIFGEDRQLAATIFNKDVTKHGDEALLEVYKKLRPGEPPTIESAVKHLVPLLFDERRYELSKVGRYKYNKKLALSPRLAGQVVAENVIDPLTGELLAEAGEKISRERAQEIEKKGVSAVWINVEEGGETVKIKLISNGMVEITDFVPVDKAALGIKEKVRFSALKEILDQNDSQEEIEEAIRKNLGRLIPKHIIKDDIFATVNYLNTLAYGVGTVDDIDHLGNRRIRCVGELLQNQFHIGLSRMERVIRERMSTQANDMEQVTPQALINIRPVVAAIKEFFGSSPLSQFMDQNNPLAELTHKRRLSALGPGGLSRDRAGFEVRDVHYSHYGRMCPIETPEGPNIGLISYLASFARINEYGFIEAPYRKVDKETGRVLDEVVYMTADVEDEFIVAQANEPLDDEGHFMKSRVTARYRDQILEVKNEMVDYMDVCPRMMVSIATAMIPFLENDDTNRALMGANMQRQAVPLLKTEAPIVATGMEYKAAVDSGAVVLCKADGVVTGVDATHIDVRGDDGEIYNYPIIKFLRSNAGTCTNQRPIVSKGDRVHKGQVIADGPATSQGEISLGKNALVGFMTWEGYNYEDAVLLNERLVRDDVYTSIHIEEYSTEARDTKLGPEEITRDIPNVGEDMLKDLDENGIIRVGAEVRAGDILVGKVTPKGETELSAEERVLRAIFGEKAREVRDTSLKVPHGAYGTVVDVKVYHRDNAPELKPGVNCEVRCYIAQKRKISVGDKMAGRHGNKGVVSRILPQEDMPFLPDGTPLDIVLNPLGVPSRMNIGQVLEVHLGRAARELGIKVMTPVFDGVKESGIRDLLKEAGLDESGKTILYDGRTGEQFDNPVTVGVMYYLKLHHLVDDKIHARSTGPYSLVTQQPLGGKAQFGGQRFGEMEVWALEAYTLQEILTVKSDDVEGRVKTFEAIVKGENVPTPGVPESFKVLVKELQSLALDVRVLDVDGNEIDLKQNFDDDDYLPNMPVHFDEQNVETGEMDGYTMENSDEKAEELGQTDDLSDLFEDLDSDDFADDQPDLSDLVDPTMEEEEF